MKILASVVIEVVLVVILSNQGFMFKKRLFFEIYITLGKLVNLKINIKKFTLFLSWYKFIQTHKNTEIFLFSKD